MRMSALEEYNQHRRNLKKKRELAKKAKLPVAKMKTAIKDKGLPFMHRCPDCGEYTAGMTVAHPWRLYCSKCKQELKNPKHPKYYPKDN